MDRKYPKIDLCRTGQNIKRIMQLRGMTVKDVQEYLKLAAPQGIYHWFEGLNLPTVDNLYALSELFQVPVDALLCGNRKKYFYFCGHPCCERLYLYYEKCLQFRAG